MQVVWSDAARTDLAAIVDWTLAHHPGSALSLERRLGAVIERIGRYPESARPVEQRPGVRVVPLVRFPFRLFYQVRGDTVEILHIQHSSRRETNADR